MQKVKRWHSKKYEAFVRSLPCANCGNPKSVVHHIKGVGNFSGAGLKSDSILSMPLCEYCHRDMHMFRHLWDEQYEFVCRTVLEAVRQGVIK